jgi:molybdopterin-guanine dinucleotide biosynthesis protein A
VHKPAVEIAGRSLLDRVLTAVADANTRVVVGPRQPVPPRTVLVREEPPGGGPVAALAAGLVHATAPFVAVLAADLPFLDPPAVSALRRAALGADGAIMLDDDGREQFLTGVWRTDRLRQALPEDPAGAALRRVVAGLGLVRLALPGAPDAPPPWFDCDDQHDVTRAERWARQ